MNHPFVSKRAPIYADVPDEKWNDWRWQLSHRLNSAEEIEKVIPLTDWERKALSASNLFRVEVTPYFISLIDPNDPDDPIRKQIIPTAGEMVSFTAEMEDSLAEDKPLPRAGTGPSLPRPGADAGHHPVRILLSLLHPLPHRWRPISHFLRATILTCRSSI